MAVYEAIVVFDPALSEEQTAQQVEELKRRFTAAETGCQLVAEALWGKRQLAYPMKKKREGLYAVLRLFHQDDSGLVDFKDVERHLRYSEFVLRHLIVRMPDAIKDEPILHPPVYSRPAPGSGGPRSRSAAPVAAPVPVAASDAPPEASTDTETASAAPALETVEPSAEMPAKAADTEA